MLRMNGSVLVLVVALAACGGGPPENPPPSGFDRTMLGRWDVTVEADETYPLWFELVEHDGGIAGRLQGRVGHALALERAEASGTSLSMTSDGTTYEGELSAGILRGMGHPREGLIFNWTAVRAPKLPAPDKVEWGEPIELFSGRNLRGLRRRDLSQPNHWKAEKGVLVNEASGTDLVTEGTYENFRLHVEVNVPEGSNSGIYLRGRYEIQVQDDFGKEPDSLRMGGIYGQVTPTENAALPAGEWQSFDITLLGRFVTVVLNGKTIIDHQEIPGTTGGALDSREAEPGPIFFQGDHGRILYRNLVLTPAL